MGLGKKMFNISVGTGAAQAGQQGMNQFMDILKMQLAQQQAAQEAEKQRAFQASEGALNRQATADLQAAQNEANALERAAQRQHDFELLKATTKSELERMAAEYGHSVKMRKIIAEQQHLFDRELLSLRGDQAIDLAMVDGDIRERLMRLDAQLANESRNEALAFQALKESGAIGEAFRQLGIAVDPEVVAGVQSRYDREWRTTMRTNRAQLDLITEQAKHLYLANGFDESTLESNIETKLALNETEKFLAILEQEAPEHAPEYRQRMAELKMMLKENEADQATLSTVMMDLAAINAGMQQTATDYVLQMGGQTGETLRAQVEQVWNRDANEINFTLKELDMAMRAEDWDRLEALGVDTSDYFELAALHSAGFGETGLKEGGGLGGALYDGLRWAGFLMGGRDWMERMDMEEFNRWSTSDQSVYVPQVRQTLSRILRKKGVTRDVLNQVQALENLYSNPRY